MYLNVGVPAYTHISIGAFVCNACGTSDVKRIQQELLTTGLPCFAAGLARSYGWHALSTGTVVLRDTDTCCIPVSLQIWEVVQN